jgi:hypothetical protein
MLPNHSRDVCRDPWCGIREALCRIRDPDSSIRGSRFSWRLALGAGIWPERGFRDSEIQGFEDERFKDLGFKDQ